LLAGSIRRERAAEEVMTEELKHSEVWSGVVKVVATIPIPNLHNIQALLRNKQWKVNPQESKRDPTKNAN
jgi:hypothetical protein